MSSTTPKRRTSPKPATVRPSKRPRPAPDALAAGVAALYAESESLPRNTPLSVVLEMLAACAGSFGHPDDEGHTRALIASCATTGAEAARQLAADAGAGPVLSWDGPGTDPDVAALGLAEVNYNACGVAEMKKATMGQLANLLLVVSFDGSDISDPIDFALYGIRQDIEMYVEAFTDGDASSADAAKRLLQRLMVVEELHDRQRAWFVSQLEGRRARAVTEGVKP